MNLYNYLRKKGLYIENITQTRFVNDESERLQQRYTRLAQVKNKWYSEQSDVVKQVVKKYI